MYDYLTKVTNKLHHCIFESLPKTSVSLCQKVLEYATLLHQIDAHCTEEPDFPKSSWELLFVPVWGI